MKLKEKINYCLQCKMKYLLRYKRLFIFFNTRINISKSAKCTIEKYCSINEPWKKGFFVHNKEGVFTLSDNSTFACSDMNIHSGCKISVGKNASLFLGSGYINQNCEIRCNDHISIGENVAIASDVIIRDHDAHNIIGSKSISPIHIGNHVWIGARSMILKGVSIGDNSVIAAGSVVTHDVPPNCLAAGVPAKIKKTGIMWE